MFFFSRPERFALPVNDFDRYDREPPSCSAYETIVSDNMDEGLHGPDNCYGNRFPQEGCDTAQTRMNDVRYVVKIDQEKLPGMGYFF